MIRHWVCNIFGVGAGNATLLSPMSEFGLWFGLSFYAQRTLSL
jgi:hypothetical protein